MRADKNESRNGSLTELGLRPAAQIFNQVRYWSALDDPHEEKWDYTSHISRVERREKGISGQSAATFNAKPLLAAMLIVLLLISMGTGLYLAWPYLSETFFSKNDVTVVNGYAVHLGSRELGIVQSKEEMEAFVADWLKEQNETTEGVTYTLRQEMTYEPVLADASFTATLKEVEDAFVKHATLDLAQES